MNLGVIARAVASYGYPTLTVDWINSVNYNNVNQRLGSFYQKDLGTTNFTYNERNELTAIQAPGTTVQYEFSATADNGQILSRTMNGEKVAYQYDTLKRLISATATVGATTTWEIGRAHV